MSIENIVALTFLSNRTNKLQSYDLFLYGIYEQQLLEDLRKISRLLLIETSKNSLCKELNVTIIHATLS